MMNRIREQARSHREDRGACSKSLIQTAITVRKIR